MCVASCRVPPLCPRFEECSCSAPMGDSPSDLSQEDHLDHQNPSLQSFGSDLPTSRFAVGPGISSQFTTQGAPSGAWNQRLAESASNLVQDPRSLDSSNTSQQSQLEYALSGSHRGVNTDGGSSAVVFLVVCRIIIFCPHQCTGPSLCPSARASLTTAASATRLRMGPSARCISRVVATILTRITNKQIIHEKR